MNNTMSIQEVQSLYVQVVSFDGLITVFHNKTVHANMRTRTMPAVNR